MNRKWEHLIFLVIVIEYVHTRVHASQGQLYNGYPVSPMEFSHRPPQQAVPNCCGPNGLAELRSGFSKQIPACYW